MDDAHLLRLYADSARRDVPRRELDEMYAGVRGYPSPRRRSVSTGMSHGHLHAETLGTAVPPKGEHLPRLATRSAERPQQSPNAAPSPLGALLRAYWADQSNQLVHDTVQNGHSLPLARIKKVIKSDSLLDPLMIAFEVPILHAKLAEAFIEELAIRAWLKTEGDKRRTLQKSHVIAALAECDMYDFLVDVAPLPDPPSPSVKPFAQNSRAMDANPPAGPRSAHPLLTTAAFSRAAGYMPRSASESREPRGSGS